MSSDDIVIVAATRTPFGKFGGVLRDVSAVDLGVHVVRHLLDESGLASEQVDELDFGCCIPAETQGVAAVVARQILLKAGLPADRPSVTIDRACCSGLSAGQWAWRSIRLGDAGLAVAGGTDNMSAAPHLVRGLRWGVKIGSSELEDPLYRMEYKAFNPVSVDAGEVALEYGEDRDAQDRWALLSQHRYQQALAAGRLKDEISPMHLPGKRGDGVLFEADELPRPDSKIESLARLPTVYGSPTVTPGNAPGLDAGAAGLILASRGKAEDLGLDILGRLVLVSSTALAPRQIASVPAAAIQKALSAAGWQLSDLDLIEINEAFAAMPLVSSRILADGDEGRLTSLREIINVNGGAIAIGHPIGASGARILLTLIYELRRRGGGRGAAAICGGLAQGECALVEV